MIDSEHNRMACQGFEARLEDLLERGAEPDAELAAHLKRCLGCREALEAARFAGELLREGLEPAAEPSGAFATRVLARIRELEARGQQFWRPLEFLASRMAMTAALVLLVLAGYLYRHAPPQIVPPAAPAQVTDGFPQPDPQPSTNDEILMSLAERKP